VLASLRMARVVHLQMGLFLPMVFALVGVANAERLPVKTYTTADGLPRDHITRIIQDSKGFIWFGTTEGLSRFDGYTFTNYGTEHGLADRQISDFIETRAGIYWVATNDGLCRFTPDMSAGMRGAAVSASASRFVTFYPSEERDARSINALCEDPSGAIWCGTDGGLYRLDDSGAATFSRFDLMQQSPIHDKLAIRALIVDRQGSLWAVASSGLYRIQPDGVVERYSHDQGLPEQQLRTIMQDREGAIWVGSMVGLYQLVEDPRPDRPVVARLYVKKDGLANSEVVSLCQSADGKLWVGTWLGLSSFVPTRNVEPVRFRSYDQAAGGLSDATITALRQDRDGNIWAGSESGGVMRIAANGLSTYGEPDGLQGIRTASIFTNQAGQLCVINGNALGGRFAYLNIISGAPNDIRFNAIRVTLPKSVRSGSWGWYQIIFQDSAGQWWLNTGDGLVKYPKLVNSGQLAHASPEAIYTTKDGLPANDVFRIFEDSRHDIWISTIGNPQGVLTRWERATGIFHCYTAADGIPEAAPTAFQEDSSGNLWIGFYSGALARYRDGRFRLFTTIGGVVPGLIRGMYLDSVGRLWAATSDLGVACSDDPAAPEPVFKTYSTGEGLSSKQATCVTEDRWGMIYVGTGRGVDKLDPSTGRVRHFTEADGLPNSFVNVALRDRDGSLWFGTLQGLCRLAPIPESPTTPPPIRITAIHIAGAAYPLSEFGTISLSVPELQANQNNIQIDFSGLSLTSADSLRYQYKLEGASSDWSAPLGERVVRYPNLPPAFYRFVVRAVSPDGSVSDTPAVVSFSIIPPVWQRWWFRLIAIIIVAMPIVALALYRHQRLKDIREAELISRRNREERLAELERVRARIATDLHDDIGSSLSQIRLLSEVARQRLDIDNEAVAEPLLMISSASRDVVRSMSDIVWAINPKKDHLSDLVHRMRRFASDVFVGSDIAFEFNAPVSDSDIRIGADVRREVFLIFKESVTNTVRHSACSQARIAFQMEGQSISLVISDNGRGFDPDKCNDGHGLGSLRERARSLGARMDIASEEGAGTTITLHLDLL
jgi:ligand-binding sensor domain-containing protein/signal transduction histidine kinase